ncbi:MAG: DUF393 domain-containing protein [Flavobacteriales bacterium]|nr:DUF393 domain-containing protein [Flavobacteriales bacterium]
MEETARESLRTEALERQPLLIYDGECKFCDGFVDFIFTHEADEEISFMWLKDDRTSAILHQHQIDDSIDSVILVEDGKAYAYSDAALRACAYLNAPWKWARGLTFVPRPIRDGVYRFIARIRKKIMGSRTCTLPIGRENRFI